MKPLTTLNIKVIPGAKSESLEWLGDERNLLKLRVKAPPEKGKANKAVIKYLAHTFDVPASSISIETGKTDQYKKVVISGLQPDLISSKLPT